MKVLLTGACGRIGAHVCRHLVAAGYDLRATDKINRANVPVEVAPAELLDFESCRRLTEGMEAVVHLANHPSYNGRNGERLFNENVIMNMNLFQAAATAGVKHIVFASSVQVLGSLPSGSSTTDVQPAYLPLDGTAPAHSMNPYALSKEVSELMLAYFCRSELIHATALRFPSILSNGESPPRPREYKCARGPAEGFAYLIVEDAARLVEAILRARPTGFRVYFPAARGNSLQRPVADVVREFYPQVPLRVPLDQLDSLVDLTAIERDTGWLPQHEIKAA